LLLPLLKDINALVDSVDGDFLLEAEDALDIDLAADFVTDLIRDALKQILHLFNGLIDVTRNSPNQLETVQQRGYGLLNH